VTERGLHASFPYVMRAPLLSLYGASIQEVAGWAIVSYLGWWLGWRLARAVGAPRARRGTDHPTVPEGPPVASPRLYVQVLWASLFLGAVSWAVEATAGAAGWWTWTVPAGATILRGVPFIGLVDWFFVGFDFLLPYLLLTSEGRAGTARWPSFVSLAVFPLHFASHLLTGRAAEGFPVPVFHLVHWTLLGALVWLALRSDRADPGFVREAGPWRFVPAVAALIVLGDAALVQGPLLGRFDLWPSIAPAAMVVLTSLMPFWGAALSLGAAALGIVVAPLLLCAAVGVTAITLRAASGPKRSRGPAIALVSAVAATALAIHVHGAGREADLARRLDAALAARDRADLEGAVLALRELGRDHPESHAPLAFLGEIEYRLGRLTPARESFRGAVAIKRDFVMGHRYLAVIALSLGDMREAERAAEEGLAWAPGDLELLYVRARAQDVECSDLWRRAAAESPGAVLALASLASETGDAVAAAGALDEALGRWPDHREIHAARVRLAMAAGDALTARRLAEDWRARHSGRP